MAVNTELLSKMLAEVAKTFGHTVALHNAQTNERLMTFPTAEIRFEDGKIILPTIHLNQA